MHATPFKDDPKLSLGAIRLACGLRNIVLIVAIVLAVLAVADIVDTRGRPVHQRTIACALCTTLRSIDELELFAKQVNIEVAVRRQHRCRRGLLWGCEEIGREQKRTVIRADHDGCAIPSLESEPTGASSTISTDCSRPKRGPHEWFISL